MKPIDFLAHKKKRLDLIHALEAQELDKTSFILSNVDLYEGLDITEPTRVSSVEEGVFYYQYYNTMAKYNQMKYREMKETMPQAATEFQKLSDEQYAIKERVSYLLLYIIDAEDIRAYYVKSASSKLKSKLVEIVLIREEKVIMHTLDQRIIASLKSRSILNNSVRPSIIDTYINKPYYEV
ncbi:MULTISPECIES: DUF6648 family protein [unclassified Fusibacter]|uniref:DUF6648 family protein n=1 Tax=unclassified Fusibacter TaxID=2624464 RepID=UPI0010103D31|nr:MULTISPECIES: DUF6648 family protein [unclassified Fusibacter]MCK8060711.1 hypothetical protein [Fusibacter sp. A2]NPE22835.1 hypothetical protein [Fusibacter sp. A1]RXV59904.1 hypothetical protein DWB64_13395 [Fusibacter sp. A1]